MELNLVEEGYEGGKLVFGLKGFPKLKMLRLHDLRHLRWMVIENGALPVLHDLRIGACPLFEGVPSGIQHLSNLEALSFSDMPPEFIASLVPENGSCYSIVKHVPKIFIRSYNTLEKRWISHPLHRDNSC